MAGKHDKAEVREAEAKTAEVKEAENNIMKQAPVHTGVKEDPSKAAPPTWTAPKPVGHEDPDKAAIRTLKEKHAKAMKYIEELEREKLRLTDTVMKQAAYIEKLKEAIIREVTR